ncbi:MAG TPA: methyltransferase domain-containing protein [Candidatus Sulfotelmatobacter sp.]|nr:methyltransferase domain-containing protein [Candidatus Sulfotelmatobacter sp.]
MAHRVCPWWLGYWLACPVRRLWQNPSEILAPFVREGQIVLEPGPGMGFFSLELARLVGKSGRVFAVDIQSEMLEGLKRRAAKAGYGDRIETRLGSADSMGISDLARAIDFTLAFAVVHEFPDVDRFFAEIAGVSKKSATLLLAEPKGHVKERDFEAELNAAFGAGFKLADRPAIRHSHAALLEKN